MVIDQLGVRATPAALGTAELALAAIVESSDDAIIGKTLEGVVSSWNPGAERLYGYAAAEMVGRPIARIVPPDRLDELAGIMGRLRRGERIDHHETVRVTKDGRRLDVSVSIAPIADGAGRTVGAATIARNVTERRRAEEALGRSRDELAAVLQGITDGVTVQEPGGRLVYANEAAARLLGEPSAEALLAVSPAELLREFAIFDEAGRPFPLADLPGRRALAGERTPRVTVRWRHLATGEDRWSVVGAEPVLDREGRVRLAVNTFQDVTERRRAEERQRFLAEAGAVLASSLDHEATLASVADLAVPGLADWCAVDVLEEGGPPRRLAIAHVDPAKVALARELGGRYPADPDAPAGLPAVLRTGRPELYAEITDEMLVAGARDAAHLAILRGVGMTSAMVVPLVARGRTLGAVSLVAAESGRRYGPADLALAEELARRTALAVDNARLHGRLADREARLRHLVDRLLVAQEEERRRVAYDVHDGLAQVAAGAHQHLQGYAHRHAPRSPAARAELDRALELARRTIREARRIVANLRPTVLDDFGLAAAIRLQVEELRDEGWDIAFDEALGPERLSLAAETALFRAAQEALTNVRKHGGTTRVRVALERREQRVRLEVRDWGRGFDPADPGPGIGPGEHVGLAGMRERIALLGGRWEVRSRPAAGTRVRVEVPLGAAPAPEEAARARRA